jgi:thiamine biosynthesis lipoprotein
MNKLKSLVIIILVIVLTACFTSKNPKKEVIFLQGLTMGTTYNIKLVVKNDSIKIETLQGEIDSLLKQVNQEMSTYIPTSELSLFNKSQSTEPVEISPGLQRVIKESIRLGQMSEGKLDITIGPLVNLWGFGPQNRPETVPSDKMLAATKGRIGLKFLSLEGNKLTKAIPELYVDLSTTAKGYGVDVVAELIEKKGIQNYLVEIGGEMRVKGFKASGELWVIAIEKPMTDVRSIHQFIVPKDNAVATSGDYRNYFEAEKMRFSHIIDPDTGKPINHKLVSVTVIHPSSMTADGLSTAMMVMGADKAFEFANQHNIAAYIISKTDNGFKEQITVKFMPFLK